MNSQEQIAGLLRRIQQLERTNSALERKVDDWESEPLRVMTEVQGEISGLRREVTILTESNNRQQRLIVKLEEENKRLETRRESVFEQEIDPEAKLRAAEEAENRKRSVDQLQSFAEQLERYTYGADALLHNVLRSIEILQNEATQAVEASRELECAALKAKHWSRHIYDIAARYENEFLEQENPSYDAERVASACEVADYEKFDSFERSCEIWPSKNEEFCFDGSADSSVTKMATLVDQTVESIDDEESGCFYCLSPIFNNM